MRVLVACQECKRQYDASRLAIGNRFRCLCGEVLEVPEPHPHDAAVVRCSSCGAPREQESSSCRFCNADFTLHERDLHTICPACMTRVSDRARFCHHCASPLLAASEAGSPSEDSCPACGEERRLTSRRLGRPGIGVLECPSCAGLWLANEELELVLKQARATAQTSPAAVTDDPQMATQAAFRSQEGALYRPCPVCRNLMHRRNFGRKSGIIIDHCRSHGYWFDAQELESMLRWIHKGGEIGIARLEQNEKREAARQQQFDQQFEPTDIDPPLYMRGTGSRIALLAWVLGWIFDR